MFPGFGAEHVSFGNQDFSESHKSIPGENSPTLRGLCASILQSLWFSWRTSSTSSSHWGYNDILL